MKVLSKDIAKAVHKTPSAISYLKRNNPDVFSLLKFAVVGMKLGLDEQDLQIMKMIKDIDRKKGSLIMNKDRHGSKDRKAQ